MHGLVGVLVLTGFLVAAFIEARRRPSDAAERLRWVLYVLPLPLIQLLTAYGLITLRKWGRVLALIFSVLYVWVFPFGTLLAVYTWWVLYGESGRNLYSPNSPEELSER
ncbi:MAG: hypothetical protein QOH49_513 [Acidobacteriota bacterium]|jgi:hypothetical protein|nr:hypothetical protein [Acidobacteriota bacterium]